MPAAIVALVVLTTWAFEKTAPESTARLLLVFPLFPGFVAGLVLSGHGGDRVVAYGTAIAVNSALYTSLWFFGRALFKTIASHIDSRHA